MEWKTDPLKERSVWMEAEQIWWGRSAVDVGGTGGGGEETRTALAGVGEPAAGLAGGGLKLPLGR